VLVAERANMDGVLAIVAAPTIYETPVKTCLAAVLQGDAPVVWECPGGGPNDLARSHVLVAAAAFGPATPAKPGPANAMLHPGSRAPRLLVYGRHGLVETLTLDLKPGHRRALH
jgi:hypothetical protein